MPLNTRLSWPDVRLIIGLGLTGFVALVVVAVVIKRRRNRARQQVGTVQLVNPSHAAVAAPQVVVA